jgi:diguanylate cyclase (GGDEF)-like protein
MRKFRSAVELVGGGALVVGFLTAAVLVASPARPVPLLLLSTFGSILTLVLVLRRVSPQSEEVLSLTDALSDRNVEVQTLAVELEELSLIDPLTGARNRRGFINLVEHQMRVATREWNKLHFLFVDVDGIKMINDLYGHAAGDSALTAVVEILWASSRTVDIVGRLGDDEFAVALLNAEDPSTIAARIRSAVSGRTRTPQQPYELHVTVGIATFDPAAPVSVEEMVKQADQAIAQQRAAAAEARTKGLTVPVIL